MKTVHFGGKAGVLRLLTTLVLVATGLTMASSLPSSASGLNLLTNGGFESGGISPGWTTYNAGYGGWGVTSNGSSTFGPANAPVEGNFEALLDQNGPTSGVLVSDPFTVPTNSTLSLDFAYVNAADAWSQSGSPFDLSGSSGNQWLRVDVIKASASYDSLAPSDILLTLFDSQSGSPGYTQNWTTLSSSLASLAGQSVEIRVAAVDTQYYQPVWVDNVDVTGPPPSVNDLVVTPGAGMLTATWAPDPNATSYTCTLMYGFLDPSSFTSQTTSSSCAFTGLAPGSIWGIQVVATGNGVSSVASTAFGTVPVPVPVAQTPKPKPRIYSIVCKQNSGKRRISVSGVHPHCPSGYHRIS